MKKLNKYLLATFAAVLSAGLFSCVEEAPAYEPGQPDVEGCQGVYFPTQAAAGEHTFDPTMEKVVTVTAARTNSEGEITVPVTVKVSEEGIFNVGEIKFADGQTETTFDVTFPNAETAVKYDISLSVEDPAYASLFNANPKSVSFSVFCVEWKWVLNPNTNEPADVTFYETWWDEVHVCKVKYYEVDGIRHCVAYTEDPEEGVWGMQTDLNFVWNTATDDVDIPQNFMGWDYDDQGHPKAEGDCSNPVYVFDWYSYFVASGQYSKDVETFYANNADSYPRSYYDAKEGIFYLNCQFYIIGLGGWTGNVFDTEAWVDGYTRVDYSIDVEAGETVEGVVPVSFALGADVTSVKYAVAEGALDAKAAGKLADAIKDGTAENVQTLADVEAPYAAVTAATTGVYTVVAVSYAGEESKESAYATFTYVTAEDAEAYAAVISVGTEPTSAMYEHVGYNGVNSFEFFIYGSDLANVKMGIFKTSVVEANDMSLVVANCTDVDDETLEKINAEGYSDIVTGLNALTSYTVVVAGSNGYNTKVATAEFTTDGLPLEPIGKGTYTYTCMFDNPQEDEGLVLSVDPNYKDTYAISDWFYGVDFKFTWNKETGDLHVLDQPSGYYASNYSEDVYVMEFADYAGQGDTSYAKDNVLFFNVIYYISAGYFGYGWEKFVIDDSNPSSVRAIRVNANELTENATPKHSRYAGIAPERDVNTVAVKVAQGEKPVRSAKRVIEVVEK